MMRRLLVLLTVVVAQAIPAVAESREKDLDASTAGSTET